MVCIPVLVGFGSAPPARACTAMSLLGPVTLQNTTTTPPQAHTAPQPHTSALQYIACILSTRQCSQGAQNTHVHVRSGPQHAAHIAQPSGENAVRLARARLAWFSGRMQPAPGWKEQSGVGGAQSVPAESHPASCIQGAWPFTADDPHPQTLCRGRGVSQPVTQLEMGRSKPKQTRAPPFSTPPGHIHTALTRRFSRRRKRLVLIPTDNGFGLSRANVQGVAPTISGPQQRPIHRQSPQDRRPCCRQAARVTVRECVEGGSSGSCTWPRPLELLELPGGSMPAGPRLG